MATRSALINVMHKAATAASRGMLRDFGEVENLQVSRKGPADFVSRADTNAERVILDENGCTFLYADNDQLVFMHAETFEQITITADMVGDRAAFLQDGMVVTMSSYEGDPISIDLPDTVVMQVVEADAVVKGQTASSSYKPAVLENGVRVMVPPHIETGTRIVVRPEDASYVERAKN